MSEYIVKTASAKMPSSCKWGPYYKIAVMEIEQGSNPCRIDDRLRCVRSVVQVWDRLWGGKTERSAYGRALAEAKELASYLNAKERGYAA